MQDKYLSSRDFIHYNVRSTKGKIIKRLNRGERNDTSWLMSTAECRVLRQKREKELSTSTVVFIGWLKTPVFFLSS